MVTCVVFDTGNENYREIHGNFPVGRAHTKNLTQTSSLIVQEKKLDEPECTKTLCTSGKTSVGCYYWMLLYRVIHERHNLLKEIHGGKL